MLKCLLYLFLLSLGSFVVGRLVPKEGFHADSFPFRSFRFERDGHVYDRLHVNSWQNKLPDMSRIAPHLMPQKNLKGDFVSRLPMLVTETCVAELTHIAEAVLGLVCVIIWEGIGGIVMSVLYALGNIPYIIIQRYNRPRLLRLMRRAAMRKGGSENAVQLEGFSSH